MKRMAFMAVALAAILGVVLAGGCGEKSEATSSGPAAGKTLVVMTVNSADTSDFASTTKVGDVTQNRNQIIKFTPDSSDDRLDGTAEMTVNNDATNGGGTTGWGTLKITNERGTWEGDWEGASGAKINAPVYISQKLTGSGDYEGLTAYFLCVMPASTLGFDSASISAYTGWIEPAK